EYVQRVNRHCSPPFAPPPCHLHSFPTRRSSDLLRSLCGLVQQRNHQWVLRNDLGGLQVCTNSGAARRKLAQDFVQRLVGKRLHKDRKSTRLNSSHVAISYAVFCLKTN